LFIGFEIVFCIVDVKEKKRKERENNDRKRDVCVFVYFFLCMLLNQRKNEFNILIYMHKYLKDR
jgi:hypothetical protein